MADTQHPPITLGADFFAKADADRARVQAEHKADFQRQLEEARANGGVYVADAPAPPVQGALPMPPGFVGALAQYIYQHAPRPVAEVAIVGALGLIAGVAGRVWYIPKSGLNLYVVLVARSAIGKEAMHSGVNTLIQAAREFYGEAGLVADPSDFASGQALLKACAQNPCFVNLAGELGHKFALMAENRDASMRSLRKQMTTLYSKSGPDGVAGGISYSAQENNVESTQAVAFSLIGETTPGTFYESITDAMMSDGFMSRFCVIEYLGDRPARNRVHVDRPPEPLVRHLATIMQHAGKASAAEVFQKVEFTPSAQALLDRFDEECDVGIVGQDDENLRQLWNRAHLKALRVAALLAVGDQYLNPVVTEEQAAWAISLVRHGVAAFDKRIRHGDIGEGSDGGREQKVLELCYEFQSLPADKLPTWLKNGKAMQDANIVPRKYLQLRTQRLSAFGKHKFGHTAALDMAIKTAVTNGNLMEVKGDKLVEMFSFHGKAFRVLCST